MVVDRLVVRRRLRDVGRSAPEHAAVVGNPVVARVADIRSPAVLEDPRAVRGRHVSGAVVAADKHVFLRVRVVPADEQNGMVRFERSLSRGMVEGVLRRVHVPRERVVHENHAPAGLKRRLHVLDERLVGREVELLKPKRGIRTAKIIRILQMSQNRFVSCRETVRRYLGGAAWEWPVGAFVFRDRTDPSGEGRDGLPVPSALLEDVLVRSVRLRRVVVVILLCRCEWRRRLVDVPRKMLRRQAQGVAALREDVRFDRGERGVRPACSGHFLVADGRDAAQAPQVERHGECRRAGKRLPEDAFSGNMRQVERAGTIARRSGPAGACVSARLEKLRRERSGARRKRDCGRAEQAHCEKGKSEECGPSHVPKPPCGIRVVERFFVCG